METVCNALPGSFKNECISLVEDNFDMIWKLLLSYVVSSGCKLMMLSLLELLCVYGCVG